MDAWMEKNFAFGMDSRLSTPEVGIHRSKASRVERKYVKKLPTLWKE